MRETFVALGIAVLVVVASTALLTAGEPEERLAAAQDAGAASWDATVVSFDGTLVPITVYKPAGASAETPVPIVLHSHGWGGSRIRDGSGLPGRLWAEGFGVITIDARGHGESVATAEVHHKDFETKDTIAVLDHVYDELDWVRKEPASGIPKDIVAGGAGYSYGGAMQLMAASYDKRLDALAPDMTWTDLPYALAPEGVAKSVWLDILIYFARDGGVTYDPRIDQWYQQILVTNEVPQDALDHFAGSSPALDSIDADVLFIQGVPDVLFNLNQALRGYETLNAAGRSDVRLHTHLTGHVLPGVQPFATSQERRETFQDGGPCGIQSDLTVAWLDEKLRGGPASGIPEVSFALEGGECVALDALPTTTREASAPAAVTLAGAGSVLVPLDVQDVVIAGIPRLTATVDAPLPETAFVGLVVASPDGATRIVDDQTTPARLATGTLALDLAGVATRLAPGERLFLRLDGANEWYAHNSDRTPGAVVLRDLTLTLPVVE